ncbi:MAG: YdeI/OmpD-associated family protein [Parvibaculaceae bacterium]
MATTLSSPKSFSGTAAEGPKGGLAIALGFDPVAAWGRRARYHVGGTINGRNVRAIIDGADMVLVLTSFWRRDCGIEPGTRVSVILALEGPEIADFGEDFAAALAAEPEAAAFFEELAQFYRKGYLAWIDGTKRRPEERARRIAETVRLLKAGVKSRPR